MIMNIKGSKTEKNLWTAFSGESQARNKYVFFAKAAETEGYDEIASIFKKTANQEEEHAKIILKFLDGIKDTKLNLKKSIQSENYEASTMYKEYEKIALEEGFTEIANFFKEIARIEEEHERKYSQLLKDILDK